MRSAGQRWIKSPVSNRQVEGDLLHCVFLLENQSATERAIKFSSKLSCVSFHLAVAHAWNKGPASIGVDAALLVRAGLT